MCVLEVHADNITCDRGFGKILLEHCAVSLIQILKLFVGIAKTPLRLHGLQVALLQCNSDDTLWFMDWEIGDLIKGYIVYLLFDVIIACASQPAVSQPAVLLSLLLLTVPFFYNPRCRARFFFSFVNSFKGLTQSQVPPSFFFSFKDFADLQNLTVFLSQLYSSACCFRQRLSICSFVNSFEELFRRTRAVTGATQRTHRLLPWIEKYTIINFTTSSIINLINLINITTSSIINPDNSNKNKNLN